MDVVDIMGVTDVEPTVDTGDTGGIDYAYGQAFLYVRFANQH